MAKLGKKAHADPPVDWKISIRQSTAAQVGLLLADPLTGRIKHGARAKLVNKLLDDWLESQRSK